MPLGFERLNVKTQPPNPSINFIKPLSGPDEKIAHDFLSRLAAIASPITRANHISVMSIEEFEPNREFWGRNFNAGECIQLVLKSPTTGRWLPFRFVQMVFMHELAHCKQMNHSRGFWAVRNQYSEDLKQLWQKGYTGDGLWGRGQNLYDGQYAGMDLPSADAELVGNLCGGSYRGARRGKRTKKDRPKETYAEVKQRRIRKRFGEGGETVGDDEDRRRVLEGKSTKGKPRVAGSNRGRELRAAAALQRFETSPTQPEKEDESETESESDFEERHLGTTAKDAQGHERLDSEGNRLVRVCEGEDSEGDIEARREMRELGEMSHVLDRAMKNPPGCITIDDNDNEMSNNHKDPKTNLIAENRTGSASSMAANGARATANAKDNVEICERPASRRSSANSSTASRSFLAKVHKRSSIAALSQSTPSPETQVQSLLELSHEASTNVSPEPEANPEENTVATSRACPVCSLENTPDSLTCAACAHVLQPDLLPDHWMCSSDVHVEIPYTNAGDNRICGLCGVTREWSERRVKEGQGAPPQV